MTYAGRCHCGGVRFGLRTERITGGIRCNCSLCTRRGAMMSSRYFTPDELAIESGETLKVYRWGEKLVDHWFCGTCGVYTFHNATERPGHYRVNLGCLEDVDPLSLAIELVDGRSF